ncbi:hypothetical protein [Niabella hibiscisoli]|nr:hypothetical protein [Niabella hibiscisoli]
MKQLFIIASIAAFSFTACKSKTADTEIRQRPLRQANTMSR